MSTKTNSKAKILGVRTEHPDSFTRSYIEAMFFASTLPPYDCCPDCDKLAVLDRWDESSPPVPVCASCSERSPNHEPPADANYDPSDLTPEALARIKLDCAKFQADNAEALADYPTENAGHDFFLTRNRHGAGFWENDFGTEAQCELLTAAAHAFGEVNFYVQDDGKINL